MKFIADLKGAWTHYSTRALAFAASIQATWITIPAEVKASFPAAVNETVAWCVFIVVVAGLFGKFVDQSPKQIDLTNAQR